MSEMIRKLDAAIDGLTFLRATVKRAGPIDEDGARGLAYLLGRIEEELLDATRDVDEFEDTAKKKLMMGNDEKA